MSEIMLAGISIALLSLMFSSVPFIQLVYIISVQYVTTWEDLINVTVIMLIATYGGTVWRKTK